jgi:hypothetical protein
LNHEVHGRLLTLQSEFARCHLHPPFQGEKTMVYINNTPVFILQGYCALSNLKIEFIF